MCYIYIWNLCCCHSPSVQRWVKMPMFFCSLLMKLHIAICQTCIIFLSLFQASNQYLRNVKVSDNWKYSLLLKLVEDSDIFHSNFDYQIINYLIMPWLPRTLPSKSQTSGIQKGKNLKTLKTVSKSYSHKTVPYESRFMGKDTDAWKDWGHKEKGVTEDEMVGWHHRFNEHECEQTPGDSEGQGSLACYSPWGHKESDMTEQLNSNHEWEVKLFNVLTI